MYVCGVYRLPKSAHLVREEEKLMCIRPDVTVYVAGSNFNSMILCKQLHDK